MQRVLVVVALAACGGDPCEPDRIANQAATQVGVDATHVYWSEAAELVRAPRRGGSREVIAGAVAFGSGLAAADGVVYWAGETIADGPGVFAGSLKLADLGACGVYPNVAVDGDSVFAAAFACNGAPPELVVVPRAGGPAVRTALASDALRIVAGDGAAQMIVGDELVAIAAAGGEPVVLAQVTDAEVLGRDAGEIFLGSGNAVIAILAAGGPARPVSQLAERARAVVVDTDRLFAITGTELVVLARAGGEPRTLASAELAALAGEGDTVAWADAEGVVVLPTCAAD